MEIWDISVPSQFRPSENSSEFSKSVENLKRPQVIKHFSSSDLDFYNIRQQSAPCLRCLQLDENHVYIVEEDHRWLVGEEASLFAPRLHKVKTIGIPFASGPSWVNECSAGGDANVSFCERSTDIRCKAIYLGISRNPANY